MNETVENVNTNPLLVSETKSIEVEWFDQLIHHINSDKYLIGEKLASKETTAYWNMIFEGDLDKVMSFNRQTAKKHFIAKLIIDYMKKIQEFSIKPNKLLMDYNDSELLIWGEVNDDDEETETNLFRLEGQINAQYYKYGFQISSTIVESSDKFNIPPHYKELLPFNTPV